MPSELFPFLELNAKRLRNLGLAAAIGFGLFVLFAMGLGASAMFGDVPAFVTMNCKDPADCIARHRSEELTKAFIFGALTLLPVVIGVVTFVRYRNPLSTQLAKAIAGGGAGLRAVYPRKTTVLAAGVRLGDSYEIVFERQSGEPWKWLVKPEDIQGIMAALRRTIPNVLTEPPPF